MGKSISQQLTVSCIILINLTIPNVSISWDRGYWWGRSRIGEADVGDPDWNPELQHVGLNVFGGEDGVGVGTVEIPELKAIFFTTSGDLNKSVWNLASNLLKPYYSQAIIFRFYLSLPNEEFCL